MNAYTCRELAFHNRTKSDVCTFVVTGGPKTGLNGDNKAPISYDRCLLKLARNNEKMHNAKKKTDGGRLEGFPGACKHLEKFPY